MGKQEEGITHDPAISGLDISFIPAQGQVDITLVANVRPIKMRLVIFKNNDLSAWLNVIFTGRTEPMENSRKRYECSFSR